MNGKLFLAGGGSPEQEQPVISAFLASLRSPEILYIPLALDPSGPLFAGAGSWIQQALEKISPACPFRISTLSDPASVPDQQFGGIFIGGGNTYRLIHAMKVYGLEQLITRQLQQGGSVYGGSAGAIILGKKLDLAQSERIGLTYEYGLGLIGDISCCCHYKAEDKARVEGYVRQHGSSVLCLGETAGVVVSDSQVISCGRDPAFLFAPNGVKELVPGDILPNTLGSFL